MQKKEALDLLDEQFTELKKVQAALGKSLDIAMCRSSQNVLSPIEECSFLPEIRDTEMKKIIVC